MAAVGITIRQFSFILSNELIASLLVILTSLRLIEHRSDSPEPPYFIYLLGLFLAVTKFIFQIDFIFGIYAFAATFYYLYQFFPTTFKERQRLQSLKTLTRIIVFSIPVALGLFLVFPQIKFNGQTSHSYGLFSTIGTSGFSAELRPGSISEIVNTNDVAFRVEFFESAPSQQNLYWRGQVLDRPTGLFWRRSNPVTSQVDSASDSLPSYKIMLEPHQKEQLFSLYKTTVLNSNEKVLYSDKNDTYALANTLDEKLIYTGSLSESHRALLKDEDRNYYLHLSHRSEKIDDLVKSLSSKKMTAFEKTQSISHYYSKSGFRYQMKGLPTENLSLDYFLFQSKIGFCEHYASASALLLRYWNVPSRVVVGYQGGEFNKSGHFWTVAQKDAHAWVEYLDENNEWILYDPVIAVAPERLTLGASEYLSSNVDLTSIKELFSESKFFDDLSNTFENFNYHWTLFFLEYSNKNIKDDLYRFYQENEDVRIATQLIAMLVMIFVVFEIFKKRLTKKTTLADQFLNEFQKFFKRYHLEQNKNELFEDWKTRIKEKLTSDHEQVDRVFDLYLESRFGSGATKKDLQNLKSLLKSL